MNGRERGRVAAPGAVAAAPPAWRGVVAAVARNALDHNIIMMAAAVAFFAFLAIPSGLTALVSLYGLAFNPNAVQHQIHAMRGLLPDEVITFISYQLRRIIAHSSFVLSARLVGACAVAFLAARTSVAVAIAAINIAYRQGRRAGLWRHHLRIVLLTGGTLLFGIVALALVALLPAVRHLLPLGDPVRRLVFLARWPLLLLFVILAIAASYRFAPAPPHRGWRALGWGVGFAAVLWIFASAILSLYVGATAGETSGALGAVVALLLWLYLAALALLIGAELNAELEARRAGQG